MLIKVAQIQIFRFITNLKLYEKIKINGKW